MLRYGVFTPKQKALIRLGFSEANHREPRPAQQPQNSSQPRTSADVADSYQAALKSGGVSGWQRLPLAKAFILPSEDWAAGLRSSFLAGSLRHSHSPGVFCVLRSLRKPATSRSFDRIWQTCC